MANEYLNPALMESLMKDPAKRAIILDLLNSQKSKKNTPESTNCLKKLKESRYESPTSLQRRRALELQNAEATSEGSSSDASEVPSDQQGPTLPLEELLKGVIAYVEVKRNNEDRSKGIKTVMRLMGAEIRETFTNDVTHVVFKDGSFTTYEKAKLLKAHVVSVLWIDAVRRHSARVPEKNYPAFGSRVSDTNVSVLCSQIQKEYKDIVKDERRRRQTLLSSSFADLLSQSTELPSHGESPEMTSDDSDCGMINGEFSKKQNINIIQETRFLTEDSKSSNESRSLLGTITIRNKKKTCECRELSVEKENLPKNGDEAIKHKSLINISNSSDMVLTPIADKNILQPRKARNKNKEQKTSMSKELSEQSTMSSLRILTDSDKTKSNLEIDSDRSKENSTVTTATTMSSLRLSEESEGAKPRNVKKNVLASSEAGPSEKNTHLRKSHSMTELQSNSLAYQPVVSLTCIDDKIASKENTKVRRRLYNAKDLIGLPSDEDDIERLNYRKQKTQMRQPDKFFLDPNALAVPAFPIKQKKITQSESASSSEDSKRNTPKKRARKPPKVVPQRRSSEDAQKELLNVLENPNRRNTRRNTLSQLQSKYQSSTDLTVQMSPVKRRSTLDFESISQMQSKRRLKLDPKRDSSIVCTKFHRNESANLEVVVNKLGRFFVEDKVTGRTSHLVAGEAKRTVNILRAIARGCWILKHEWLLKSQKAGKWLNEEDYELTEFSPAVQQCRLEKEAFGPLYSMDVFKDCGYIYISKCTKPSCNELRELISICKGQLTNVHRNADIVVGEYHNKSEMTCVTESWVLDSIAFNKCMSFKKYLIKPEGNESPNF